MITLMPADADLFASQADTLVCPVNTFGYMGKGLALAFAKRYPNLFEYYRQACYDAAFADDLVVWRPETGPSVWLFPTKFHWSRASRMDWIEQGLEQFRNNYRHHSITSLAIPALGCGEGHLTWTVVERALNHYLGDLVLPVEVYPPH